MTSSSDTPTGAVGSLGVAGDTGVVRIEQRYDTDPADLWAAVTEPDRLARWYGHVSGELRVGGQLAIRIDGPDIDSTGRILECTPPSRLRVQTRETDASAQRGAGQPFDTTIEVTLTPDDGRTVLVIEVRGLPLGKIAAYGVGWQLHAESLSNHVRGLPGADVGARWTELAGHYETLAAGLG